jgi:hypothetical protein
MFGVPSYLGFITTNVNNVPGRARLSKGGKAFKDSSIFCYYDA